MAEGKTCPQCGKAYGANDRFCTVDGATLVSTNVEGSLIGTVLAERYLVQEKLGEGGMGEVYLAEHVRMKRKVAVKLMRRWMVGDPVAVSRFHREAENASQITHANVAQVYDFGETSDGLIYLAMEFIPGETLLKILVRERRLNIVRTADVVRQVSNALDAAHSSGILHRDLKPDNVMVSKARSGTDMVKLVDFGIARVMNRGTQQFTSTGFIVGTPDYMSPEQLAGDTLDARADNYALALMAFRMLTGQGAFPEGATQDALLARLTRSARPLRAANPDVNWPDTLQAAFDKALAADPAERYAEAVEFAAQVDDAVTKMPLGAEEQAYLLALAQRHGTTPRASAVVDESTPSYAIPAPRQPTPTASRPRIVLERTDETLIPPPPEPEENSSGTLPEAVDAPVPVPAGEDESGESPSDEGPSLAESSDAAVESPPVVPRVPVQPAPALLRRSRRPIALVGAAVALAAIVLLVMKIQAPSTLPPVARVNSGLDSLAATPLPAGPVVAADTSATAARVPPSSSSTAAASDSERLARARTGVFAVASTSGRGSAFIVDPSGLAVTSASLVPASRQVDVFFDADHRLRGTVVQVDSVGGFATLLVPLSRCRRCRALDLAPADSAASTLREGDSLLALAASGRTTVRDARGVVSRVAPGAGAGGFSASRGIMSVGAGSPVLSSSTGFVLALASSRKGTPSLVPAQALRDGVTEANRLAAANRLQPNDSLLPTWPARAVDATVLQKAERRTADDLDPYKTSRDGFAILAMTPQVMAWRAARARALGGGRGNIFDVTKAAPLLPSDPLIAWSQWKAYLDERRAVVVLNVSSDRAAYPDLPKDAVDLRRDVYSMQVLRDGVPLVSIESQRLPAVANLETYRAANRPVLQAAVYVYSPADFAPKSDGNFAAYEAIVTDAGRPDRGVHVPIPAAMLQAIARDLAPWQGR